MGVPKEEVCEKYGYHEGVDDIRTRQHAVCGTCRTHVRYFIFGCKRSSLISNLKKPIDIMKNSAARSSLTRRTTIERCVVND